MNTSQKQETVLSVRTKRATSDRLSQLAKETRRSRSALVSEALEQYVEHQDWLTAEIQRGVDAAERGELVADDAVAAWINTLKK